MKEGKLLEAASKEGRIILKWILKKQDGRRCIAFCMCLVIENRCGLLDTQLCRFGVA
jgi:hypothetical protein